jgi:F0F1-type ATP synthase membrane subunit b/b'
MSYKYQEFEEVRSADGHMHESVKDVYSKTHWDPDTLDSTTTHTEIRAPIIHPSSAGGISVSGLSGLAKEVMGEGMTASVERIEVNNRDEAIMETPEQAEEFRKHQEKYLKGQQAIREKHEKDIARLTEEYRKKTEQEAEKIRKQMERQHERDVDFRKQLVEDAIKRQKEELALEAKYAVKEMERQRDLALDALDCSRIHTDISVNLNTTAGQTSSTHHQ